MLQPAQTGGGEVGFRTRGTETTVRAADIAYFAKDRLPPDAQTFPDSPPDLVVEVISTHDRATYVEQKTQEWLNFGVKLVLARKTSASTSLRTANRHTS